MLQRKRLLSLNSQKGTLKEATCMSQSKHQPRRAGRAPQLAAAALHQTLPQDEPSCSQKLFFPTAGSRSLPYNPGEEGKDLLVFLPVREVMLSRRVTVGDFCWGGVRHCLPSSSSAAEDTSSPMRIRSRLPSSTPFPSHRPQGNLQRAQDKHRSATHTLQPGPEAGGQLAPSKHS